MEALREYLKAEHGRARKLARAIGIGDSALSQWDRVPAERVVAIEKATGIPRRLLRPDLYDETPEPAPAPPKRRRPADGAGRRAA